MKFKNKDLLLAENLPSARRSPAVFFLNPRCSRDKFDNSACARKKQQQQQQMNKQRNKQLQCSHARQDHLISDGWI